MLRAPAVLVALMLALGAAVPAAAVGLPAAVQAVAAPLERIGEGEMRWLGFKLYDAAL